MAPLITSSARLVSSSALSLSRSPLGRRLNCGALLRWATLVAILLSQLLAGSAVATQDELRLPLDAEDRLLLGNPARGAQLMSATLGEASVAIYPVGGEHHRWHGQLWADVGVLALGPAALLKCLLPTQRSAL